MDWSKPSKEHYKYIRELKKLHTDANLDYYIMQVNDVLYIAFAESEDKEDWASNLNFYPEQYDPYVKVKAHRGLAAQYMSVRQVILDYLYGREIKEVYVAGFSLGGAITTLAVEDIGYHIDRDNLNVKVLGISYDGPRVFSPNKIVKKAVKGRLITVKTHNDPVIHVPWKIMPTFFYFRWGPFKFAFDWKAFLRGRLTFWKDYGKIVWIGHLFRFLPLQHFPDQIEKALEEKYGH